MIAAASTPTTMSYGPFDYLGIPFQYCLEGLNWFFSHIGPLNAVGAFGLAVIFTTLLIRGALFPVFGWQLRTSRRIQKDQQAIGPQLQALRKKYKGEPVKLREEMNKLYAEHGVSPFSSLSGCLPALVQMPVLVGLYRGIAFATQHVNDPAQRGFLWIHDVSQSALQYCCQTTTTAKGVTTTSSTDWGQLPAHPALLILPLLAGLFTFAQSRMMMPPLRPNMTDQERTMSNVTKQMSVIFPVIIFYFALNFQQGLAIYWVTGTLFMVLQQYHLVGWGALRVPAWLPGAHRTTALSYPKPAPTAKPDAAAAAALAPRSTTGTPNPSTRASKKRPNRRRR